MIPPTSTVLSRVFAVEGRGRDLFRAAERLDLEGIVAKRKADRYAPSTTWRKVKNRAYTQTAGERRPLPILVRAEASVRQRTAAMP